MKAQLRKLLLSFSVLLVGLVLIEVGVRVYFATKVGPDVLLYGTAFYGASHQQFKRETKSEEDHTVSEHANEMEGYSKFYPNQVRVDNDKEGNVFHVKINDRGFRGRNFSTEKEPGVIRVVTLGASSTFGYRDRDDETYPSQLEQLLNESSDRRYEVINLGVPHLKTENIYALFMAEALPLQPDVVTFYEGVNDAAAPRGLKKGLPKTAPLFKTVLHALQNRSLTLAFLHHVVFSQNRVLTKDQVAEYMKGRSEGFLQNLSLILAECRKRNIPFIVANQQSTSTSYDRSELKGLTYEHEAELLQSKLDEEGGITVMEAIFLTHVGMMRDLRAWAETNHVPFVPVIEAMDQDRDCLLSWVHLNAEGNAIVAGAFADAILSAEAIASAQQ